VTRLRTRRARRQPGQALVEFAIVLPVIVLLMFGILDLGRAIYALDVSPDQRYVAAGVNGEIAVIDLKRNAIATMTVGSPRPKHISFLDTATLAYSEVAALKTVEVDHLEYVPFQVTTEL